MQREFLLIGDKLINTSDIVTIEEKEISFILGACEKEQEILTKFKQIENCKKEYENTKNYWLKLLGRVSIKTPVEELNIILNGWAMYQTISSRLYARSRI